MQGRNRDTYGAAVVEDCSPDSKISGGKLSFREESIELNKFVFVFV